MGQDSTDFYNDELISSYIDKQIKDEKVRKTVEDMLANDSNLEKKYQSELLTKKLFQERLGNVDVPKSLQLSVSRSIDFLIQEANQKRVNRTEPIHEYTGSKNFYEHLKYTLALPIRLGSYPVPRYVFAVLLIMMISAAGVYVNYYNNSLPPNSRLLAGSDKNIVKQAISNFHKILSGEIKPHPVSKPSEDVKNFLTAENNFPVFVPDISEYKLVGTICDHYNGQKLCHLVYAKGDNMIYIYQTKTSCLQKKDLEIPDEVRQEIETHKYFMCDNVDAQNTTLTVWYRDNVVCTAVTNIPKQQMDVTFASFK